MVRKTNIIVKINILFIFFPFYHIQTAIAYNVLRIKEVQPSKQNLIFSLDHAIHYHIASVSFLLHVFHKYKPHNKPTLYHYRFSCVQPISSSSFQYNQYKTDSFFCSLKHIHNTYVIPLHRGLDLGKSLISLLSAVMRSRGVIFSYQ